MEEVIRIIIVPLLIMFGGFLLESLAIRAKGIQKGPHKFKLWLRRADDSLHCDTPCGIGEIARYARSRSESLVDVTKLTSFGDYAGLSFDLCISAFTADVIVLLNQAKVAQMAPRAAGAITIHFFFLVWVTVLVTANQQMGPDQAETGAKRRTILSTWKITSRGGSHAADSRAWEPALLQNFHLLILAIVLGLFALVSGFVMLWEAL